MKKFLLYLFLVFITAFQLKAINPTDVSIHVISGDVFHSDHNQCIYDIGPRAVYIGLEICNISTGPLDNLQVTMDGFTVPGFSLAGNQAATQNIDNPLLQGRCDTVFWFCSYPCDDLETKIIFKVTDRDDASSIYDTSGILTSTRELSANAGGFITASLLSSNDTINSITCFNVTYGLSRLVAGDDVFLQPAANTSFKADCFQLIRATVLSSDANQSGCVPVGNCPLYYSITRTCGFSPSWSVDVEYCFRVQCQESSSFLIPYASATSGNDLKYTIATQVFILPMELIYFNAVQQEGSVYIEWSTASENNTLFFEVQKSEDGINFYTIKSITAAGFSSQVLNYGAVDEEPRPVNYYRLKINNADGTSEYSAISKVVIPPDNAANSVAIHPNPAVTNLELDFEDNNRSAALQEYKIEIWDLLGKKVHESIHPLTENKIDITKIAAGTYLVRIFYQDKVRVVKLQIKR